MNNWTKEDLNKHLKKTSEQTLFPTEEFVYSKTGYAEIYQELISNVDKIIYVPNNVPSLKNSKRIMQIPTGKTICCNAKYTKLKSYSYKCNTCGQVSSILAKRASILPSKRHEAYFKEVMPIFEKNADKFLKMSTGIDFPLYVGFYFLRKIKNKWDWDNAITTVMDIMKKSGMIIEDDSTIIVPIPLGWHNDKDNGGVVITILKEQPKYNYLWT